MTNLVLRRLDVFALPCRELPSSLLNILLYGSDFLLNFTGFAHFTLEINIMTSVFCVKYWKSFPSLLHRSTFDASRLRCRAL